MFFDLPDWTKPTGGLTQADEAEQAELIAKAEYAITEFGPTDPRYVLDAVCCV